MGRNKLYIFKMYSWQTLNSTLKRLGANYIYNSDNSGSRLELEPAAVGRK